MEADQSIRKSLQQQMWTYLIDSKVTYFHIPIHKSSRKFLRTCHKGKVYQFKTLPFGISLAPWIFTKVFKQIAIVLGEKSIMIHQYLEDWLSKDMSRQTLLIHRQYTLVLVQRLECLINWGKLELEPTQVFEFVGIIYNLET